MNRRILAAPAALVVLAGSAASAQGVKGPWQFLDALPAEVAAKEPWIRPAVTRSARLDIDLITQALRRAPMEFTAANPLTISLPMPDGTYSRFAVVESPIMEPGLAAQFPEIRTYAGQGIDDPAATVRLDLTPQGFHSQILSPHGAAYIDPCSRQDNRHYSVYYKKDLAPSANGWQCHTMNIPAMRAQFGGGPDTPTGTTLRTYRLVNACTGEYAAFHGGTVALAQAAIVTAINRVTGVYEKDFAIRMTLVANNTLVVYTNAGTDPYTNFDGFAMLAQNQSTCDVRIGNANYDIGHVFSTGGGGIAGLGVVGIAGQKAEGVTGLGTPTGDPFYIDYVCHEMGHQFDGNHSFNGCGGGSGANGYEPGSGSTIMGYAGICGPDDLQPNSDPYFLWDSHDDMIAFVTGSIPSVGTQTATNNTVPTVDGGPNRNIPANTPFALTAVGSDPNPGEVLTYCWEERDIGPSVSLATPDQGTIPLFRSWNPTTNPTRTFPRLSNLLANTVPVGERLPTTNRTLRFTVSVRDNRANGGGWNSDNVDVVVTNTGAAFAVTAPNTAVTWAGGSAQTVTWNVAGTTASPINCANVDILLSTDGGNSFTTILAGTPNDGSQSVTIPNTGTTQARIKVQGAGNIFFDLSNVNFTITGPAAPPNNSCVNATVVAVGTTAFTTVNATTDGPAEAGCSFCCGDNQINQDVWFRFTSTCTGGVTASLCGAGFDTKIAVYSGSCPVGPGALACNDNSTTCGAQSSVTFPATTGGVYYIRVGGFQTATGTGSLAVACNTGPTCYPNCDNTTAAPVLTANDFSCFLNAFVTNQSYANCDGTGGLTANDFSCFLVKFTQGCS
jgi:hypothetical protein